MPDPGALETDGMYFYGYWGKRAVPALPGEEFERLWPEGSLYKHVVTPWPAYCSTGIGFAITRWPDPDAWIPLLQQSLGWFVARGAIVAWCGGELCWAGVDELDGGNLVYAAYSEPSGLICRAGLDDEMVWLGDDDVRDLWNWIQSHSDFAGVSVDIEE